MKMNAATDDQLADLGTYLASGAHASSAIVFDHFDLHQLARAGSNDYTSSRTLTIDGEFMMTFEFDKKRFSELLELLPKPGSDQLKRELGQKTFVHASIVHIPPGALIVGLRTRLGSPRVVQHETFVPFIVDSFFRPGPVMSMSFEENNEQGVGTLDLLETPSGIVHAVCGVPLRDGDVVDAWLNHEKTWVRGTYEATTSDGSFEPRFAVLRTERTGMRPIFLNIKLRRVG
jgi:hypothetical protein